MQVPLETLRKLAPLARLNLPAEAEPALQKDLTQILSWMEKLRELPTDGVEPLIHMSLEVNAFRPDVAAEPLPQEEALKNAPSTDGKWFRAPKVLDLS